MALPEQFQSIQLKEPVIAKTDLPKQKQRMLHLEQWEAPWQRPPPEIKSRLKEKPLQSAYLESGARGLSI